MATLKVTGISEITESLRKGMEIPESVMDSMLDASAQIVIKAQEKTAATMLAGPYSKGGTKEAVGPGRKKKLGDGKEMDITFKGSRHRGNTTTRNAEIAFLNEYGKKGQPARQFISKANEQSADESTAAAEAVFHAWQDTVF